MYEFRKKDLKKLIEKRSDLCVSIYIPTHPYGPGTQQATIRLKNLIREVANLLEGKKWNPSEIQEYLDPFHKIRRDNLFWEHQRDGLAIFLSTEEMITYRLPLECSETLVVSKRFHLKPLLPLITSNDHFYLLALSLGSVRLLQGNRYRISEIEVPDLPQGIEEALKYDDPERQLQHQSLSHTGGGHPAIHHGHGDIYDPKENALRYFRMVAGMVEQVLKEDHVPLILAGVEYLLPIYKEVSSYPLLLDESISGNPEEISAQTFHQQAWNIIHPVLLKQQKDVISIYQYIASRKPHLISTDLKKIVSAAYYGLIDTLFVPLGIQKWGVFIPDSNAVELQSDSTPENEDLLDFAAIYTFINGGAVYVVELNDVPGETEIAAILRY